MEGFCTVVTTTKTHCLPAEEIMWAPCCHTLSQQPSLTKSSSEQVEKGEFLCISCSRPRSETVGRDEQQHIAHVLLEKTVIGIRKTWRWITDDRKTWWWVTNDRKTGWWHASRMMSQRQCDIMRTGWCHEDRMMPWGQIAEGRKSPRQDDEGKTQNPDRNAGQRHLKIFRRWCLPIFLERTEVSCQLHCGGVLPASY